MSSNETAEWKTTHPNEEEPGSVDAFTHADFILFRQLARGGMGEVHAAYHQPTGRFVALKFPRPSDLALIPRFERECRLHRHLSQPGHRYLVKFLACSEETERPWLAVELLTGKSLYEVARDYRGRKTSVPESQAVRWLRMAAQALDYVHQRGVVHRDLKPGNLFLTGEGAVKLLDLGVSFAPGWTDDGLSRTNPPFATALYRHPNHGRGDVHTDLYALGLTGLELLSGHHIEDLRVPGQVQPSVVDTHLPQCSAGIRAILSGLLVAEKSKQDPGTAAALVARLEQLAI